MIITTKLIKSPLNYIGGKFKLLPQILPLFPNQINTFVDLFAGGCNLALNVKANKIICNDIITYIINLYQYLKEHDEDEILWYIDERIVEYQLNKTNDIGYNFLRKTYNEKRFILDLYVLSCYSFNNRIRFNSSHEFNESFGKNRSQFNKSLRERLIQFIEFAHNGHVEFQNKDYIQFDFESLSEGDFVYVDPPYLLSTVPYNDGKRGFKGWDAEQEQELYETLDKLNNRGIKFALSNVTENKGEINKILIEWANKYNTYELNADYTNSHHSRKDKNKNNIKEVLITNYHA